MVLSSQIKESLLKASQWLLSVRREKGFWQDMVYKRQGILNTAEAWRSLVQIRKVIPSVKWESQWVKADFLKLMQSVKTHGFLRSPYYPENRPHQSIDAAAFAILMSQSLAQSHSIQMSKPMTQLVEKALAWLVENQAKPGGWGWGTLAEGCPLYTYFTYMSVNALQTFSEPQAQNAAKRGLKWLLTLQQNDGSFPVHSQSDEADIASTAYAAMVLSEVKGRKATATLKRAVRYLLSTSLGDITSVGHLKLVEPDQPPQRQVDYENYSVAANVLLALIQTKSSMKDFPQLDDRIQFLVHFLLDQQAQNGGWPGSYSTIYTTHTSISALVAYLSDVQSQSQPESRPRSGHFNPYVFGFPIQHPHLFFGRDAIINRVRSDVSTSPEMKRDLALIGERRIGKTSLLYQLPFHLKVDGHQVFYIDLELMQSMPQFLQTFVAKLGEAVFRSKGKANAFTLFRRAISTLDRKLMNELDLELQMPFLKVSTTRTEDLFVAFLADVERLLERLRKWRETSRAKMVCLLDEIAYLQHLSDSSLVSLFRGLAQQTPDLVFIVAGTPKACRILTSEVSPFYNIFTPIHLGQLERGDAIALITHPVEGKMTYAPEAISILLQTSKRQPYALQALCYHCTRLLPSSQTEVTEQLVQRAIEAWQIMKDWK